MHNGIRPADYLTARGLKVTWVARRMGISWGYLSRMLSGKRPWTQDMRNTFAMVAGLDTSLFDFDVEAANRPLERVGDADEYNYTGGADDGPQGAKVEEVEG